MQPQLTLDHCTPPPVGEPVIYRGRSPLVVDEPTPEAYTWSGPRIALKTVLPRKIKVFQHRDDWERSRPQGPKKTNIYLINRGHVLDMAA